MKIAYNEAGFHTSLRKCDIELGLLGTDSIFAEQPIVRLGDNGATVMKVKLRGDVDISGCTISFEARTPERKIIIDTESDNFIKTGADTFEYKAPKEVHSFTGLADMAYFVLEKDGERTSTQNFFLTGIEDAATGSEGVQEHYISIIDKIMEDIDEALEAAEKLQEMIENGQVISKEGGILSGDLEFESLKGVVFQNNAKLPLYKLSTNESSDLELNEMESSTNILSYKKESQELDFTAKPTYKGKPLTTSEDIDAEITPRIEKLEEDVKEVTETIKNELTESIEDIKEDLAGAHEDIAAVKKETAESFAKVTESVSAVDKKADGKASKSGDTFTGLMTFDTNAQAQFLQKGDAPSARGILFRKPEDNPSTFSGGIGRHVGSDGSEKFFMGFGEAPWSEANAFEVKKDAAYFKGKKIATTDNIPEDVDISGKLNKDGDTMTGSLEFDLTKGGKRIAGQLGEKPTSGILFEQGGFSGYDWVNSREVFKYDAAKNSFTLNADSNLIKKDELEGLLPEIPEVDLSGLVKKSGDSMTGYLTMKANTEQGIGIGFQSDDKLLDAGLIGNKSGQLYLKDWKTNKILFEKTPDGKFTVNADNLLKKTGDQMSGNLVMKNDFGVFYTNKAGVGIYAHKTNAADVLTLRDTVNGKDIYTVDKNFFNVVADTNLVKKDELEELIPEVDVSALVKKAGDTMTGDLTFDLTGKDRRISTVKNGQTQMYLEFLQDGSFRFRNDMKGVEWTPLSYDVPSNKWNFQGDTGFLKTTGGDLKGQVNTTANIIFESLGRGLIFRDSNGNNHASLKNDGSGISIYRESVSGTSKPIAYEYSSFAHQHNFNGEAMRFNGKHIATQDMIPEIPDLSAYVKASDPQFTGTVFVKNRKPIIFTDAFDVEQFAFELSGEWFLFRDRKNVAAKKTVMSYDRDNYAMEINTSLTVQGKPVAMKSDITAAFSAMEKKMEAFKLEYAAPDVYGGRVVNSFSDAAYNALQTSMVYLDDEMSLIKNQADNDRSSHIALTQTVIGLAEALEKATETIKELEQRIPAPPTL
ncbi:Uncharacterized protein B5E38_4997 [Bacillus cereus]|nr:Uncharacterized protein B5E38_4997 [Bacillus cereus]ARO65083.1 Uncharacterized protein B5E39_2712 [Bacillus cereus]